MYNRLYFYATGQDYINLAEQIKSLGFISLPSVGGGESHLLPSYASEDRLRFLSLKQKSKIRKPRNSVTLYSETTFDVLSWARGYIYEGQLVGHTIEQLLPFFNKPNPNALDISHFEDARQLRKKMSTLRRWMKKNWTDYYNDGDFFGPEAMRLKLEEGFNDASYKLDNPPKIEIVKLR